MVIQVKSSLDYSGGLDKDLKVGYQTNDSGDTNSKQKEQLKQTRIKILNRKDKVENWNNSVLPSSSLKSGQTMREFKINLEKSDRYEIKI